MSGLQPATNPTLLDWLRIVHSSEQDLDTKEDLDSHIKSYHRFERGLKKGSYTVLEYQVFMTALYNQFKSKVTDLPRNIEWSSAIFGLDPLGTVGDIDTTKPSPVELKDFEAAVHCLEHTEHNNGTVITFTELINLAVCQYRSRINAIGMIRNYGKISKDFTQDYKGGTAESLLSSLHQLNAKLQQGDASSDIYAPVMAMLQSSGSGRTRTALKLCTLELGLYVCVRPARSGTVTSVPPQDESAYVSLVPESETESDLEALHTVARWLTAFVSTFTDCCKTELDLVQKGIDRASFASHMASVLTDGIVPGYQAVKTEALGMTPSESTLSNSSTGSSAKSVSRPDLLKQISDKATELESDWSKGEMKKKAASANEIAGFFADQIRPYLKRLNKVLPGGPNAICFLALDEAMSLGVRRLSAFRRILSYLKKESLWVLFLDTNNQVSELTGQKALDPSLRLRDRTQRLVSPFTEFPHDVFIREDEVAKQDYHSILLGERRATLDEWIHLLSRMGRPLWNDTSWVDIPDDEGSRVMGISMTAIFEKLIGGATTDKWSTNANMILAATAQRVPLHMTGSQGTSSEASFLERQISHHMRAVTGVHPVTGNIRSFAPSEPLMSLAVADAFRKSPSHSWSAAIATMSDRVSASELHIGETGEEFVRIMLCFAMDVAASKKSNATASGQQDVPHHLQVVQLSELLEALLGRDVLEQHSRLKDWASERWVNFTHFARMDQQYTMETPIPSTLYGQAWSRQCAILGIINQPQWDIFFPALVSKSRPALDQVIDIQDFCPIVFQVRTRVRHSPSETHRLKDFSATLCPSTASSRGSLNIYLGLKASKPTVESKVVDDCNGIHCLYVGGASQEQYPLIQGLSPKAIAGISALLGIYKLDRISGPGEYIKDFLNHCMHVEECQKPKLTGDNYEASPMVIEPRSLQSDATATKDSAVLNRRKRPGADDHHAGPVLRSHPCSNYEEKAKA